jgi:PAS domain S-box-containing protein
MSGSLPSRENSEWLVAGQQEVLEMIARGASLDDTIELLVAKMDQIEPGMRCAILMIKTDKTAFSNVHAPGLPPHCKVRLRQAPVGPPFLNRNGDEHHNGSSAFCVDLNATGEWSGSGWARELTAAGYHNCLFVPILSSKQVPVGVFSLFSRAPANFKTSASRLAQTATYIAAVAVEKKELEEQLETERERLNLALGAGELGIWNWNLVTNRLTWSEQCKKLFGYSADAEISSEHFFAALHPEDRERTMQAVEHAIRDGVPYDIEYRVLHPDGTVRWIASTGRTFTDSLNRPVRMGGAARDVTERRQFDEALQENQHQLRTALYAAEMARHQAEAAARAKDRFLAILSHELRTPLTPIMMAASWLRNAPELSEKARNAFDMIHRNVQIEARLIDDLLDLTRIARNQLELQLSPADLHTVLRSAIEVCGSDLKQKNLGLDLRMEARLTRVECDVARMQQVFWNLVKNAIKFTPEGGAIMVTSKNESGYIIVEVTDTGIGIDPQIVPKIFAAFERGDKDVAKQFGGLGLGLAISKAVVDAHGGVIAAHSDGRDQGATFGVRLRLASEQAPGR